MRRFTILGLMGLVLGLAVAIAALRNADDYWAGGLLLATDLIIGVAALGAVYHVGRRRAGRLGFAVFSGGYFALAFLGLSESNLAKLPTTWLLRYVHEKVAPTPFVYTKHATLYSTVPASWTTSTVRNVHHVSWTYNHIASPNRWKSMLPGAANYESFGAVGHCLFALLAGLMGTIIARRFQARLCDRLDRAQPG
jgi:hypothetical protein